MFEIEGRPFNGVFWAKIKVVSSISNLLIINNLATVNVQFTINENIRNIESELNKGIEIWSQTGLKYIEAWKTRV